MTAEGYRVDQNCGALTVVRHTPAFQTPHITQTGRNYTELGKKLWVTEVDGDFAKIEFGPGQFVWVHRGSFPPAEWARVSHQCEIGPHVADFPDNRTAYPSRGSNASNSGSLDRTNLRYNSSEVGNNLRNHYAKLKEFYENNNRHERYAFVNIPNGYKNRTHIIDMQEGKVVADFDSLRGYAGYGCGTGQTRPGIYRLHSARGTGASRKSHWGNNYAYHVVQNVGGHTRQWGGMGCGVDPQRVAHSNNNMSGPNSNGERYSAGCFVTSPEVFDQWVTRLAGDALIYNINPN